MANHTHMKEKLEQYVGKEFMLPFKDMRIRVKALDVKERWGNTLIEVSPVSGSGSFWVTEGSLIQPYNCEM